MDAVGTNSIFDIIEEYKDEREIFTCLKCTPSFKYNTSEILYESALITAKSTGVLKRYKYVLTFEYLIRFNVIPHCNNSLNHKKNLLPT